MGATPRDGDPNDLQATGWPEDVDPFRRAKVVLVLGRHAEPGALDQLLAQLDDPEWLVVEAALSALRRYRDPRIVAGAQAVLRNDTLFRTFTRGGALSYAAARALRAQGEHGFRALLTLLREFQEDEVRGQAVVWQLAVIRDLRATGPLIETFDSPVFEVAHRAAAMLRHFGADAIPPLIAAFSSVNGSVQYQTAWALRWIGASAVPALLDALRNNENPAIRTGAADVLGSAEGEEVREALHAALDDPDADVRRMSLWSLGQLGDPSVIEQLLAEPPGPETRSPEPATTLAWIGAEAVLPLIGALEDTTRPTYQRTNAAQALGLQALGLTGDARAVPPLVAALRDGDKQVQVAAALSLADLKDTTAVDPLLAAFDEDTPAVRAVAAYALAKIGDERAFEALARFVRESAGDRKGASGVLQMLAWNYHERALPLLREMALGENVHLRIEAMASLGRFGAGAVPTLLELARNPRPELRFGTFDWLEAAYRDSHDQRIVDYFFEVSRQDTGDKMSKMLHTSAVLALGKCGDERAVEPLIAMLQDNATAFLTKYDAIWPLGKIGDERALAALLAAYAASKAEESATPDTEESSLRSYDYQDALLRAIEKLRVRLSMPGAGTDASKLPTTP